MKIQETTISSVPQWSAEAKWGSAVEGGEIGFQVLPDVIVKGQAELGLNATEMVVLLNILLHWWDAAKWPHPRPSSIAYRMKVATRTVERAIKSLEQKGLVERLPPEQVEDGPIVRKFALTGLVKAAQKLAEITRASH